MSLSGLLHYYASAVLLTINSRTQMKSQPFSKTDKSFFGWFYSNVVVLWIYVV